MTGRALFFLCLVAGCIVMACDSGGPTGNSAAPGAPVAAAKDATAAPSPTSGPQQPVVVIDPGHGGPEVGAANHGVVEKESNLEMALRLERLLVEQGVSVVLTRRADQRASDASPEEADATFGGTRADLQARIDIANAADADLFVSLHSNGSTDPSLRGVEVYYDPNREFAAANERLAQIILDSVLSELQATGRAVINRGIVESDCIRVRDGRCFPLFVLGPPRTITREQLLSRGLDPGTLGFRPQQQSITTRPSSMPGVLVELLFVSNPDDAALLRDLDAREAMARGIAGAVMRALAEGS